MVEPATRSTVVRFGVFEVDLRAGELRKNGSRLKLAGQPFQVLAILLERPSELVTREELHVLGHQRFSGIGVLVMSNRECCRRKQFTHRPTTTDPRYLKIALLRNGGQEGKDAARIYATSVSQYKI